VYEKDGIDLEFEITASEDDAVRVDMAKVCAQQLREIGVNAKATITTNLDWENQDSTIIGWGSPFEKFCLLIIICSFSCTLKNSIYIFILMRTLCVTITVSVEKIIISKKLKLQTK